MHNKIDETVVFLNKILQSHWCWFIWLKGLFYSSIVCNYLWMFLSLWKETSGCYPGLYASFLFNQKALLKYLVSYSKSHIISYTYKASWKRFLWISYPASRFLSCSLQPWESYFLPYSQNWYKDLFCYCMFKFWLLCFKLSLSKYSCVLVNNLICIWVATNWAIWDLHISRKSCLEKVLTSFFFLNYSNFLFPFPGDLA